MTRKRLNLIRKTWQPWRGRVDWNRYADRFDAPMPVNVSALCPITPETIPTEPIIDRITFTAERCYYVTPGETYEWRNIICEGRIIDMEWIR